MSLSLKPTKKKRLAGAVISLLAISGVAVATNPDATDTGTTQAPTLPKAETRTATEVQPIPFQKTTEDDPGRLQ
jgi:hypothetical protein